MYKILYTILLFVAVSCTSQSNKNDEHLLMVTAEPYRFITEAVAGNEWNIESIVPKGSSPESYDPSPKKMVRLNNSRAYIAVGGLGFENAWLPRIKETYGSLTIFDSSKGIERSEDDPHLWTSPDNMQKIADNIYLFLVEIDADKEHYYKHRLDSITSIINETDSIVSSLLETKKGDAFLIFHPSLTYFAKRYGLEQIAIEKEGKEPTATDIKNIIDEAKAKNVKVIFVQAEFDKKNAEMMAKEIGAEIVTINPLSFDWKGEMVNIAHSLSEN